MNKNIYIFDDFISSGKNGIGTYVRELILVLKELSARIHLLLFNVEKNEFTIREENGVKTFLFPIINGDCGYQKYSKIINKFMRLYIADSSDNLFLLNHAPCENLLKSIKNSYPLSKRAFVIHDFTWTKYLDGRLDLLDSLLNKKERNEKEKYIYNQFLEERRMYTIADKVICLSKSSFDILRSFYQIPLNKITLIPNGMCPKKTQIQNKNIIRRQLYLSPKERILLYVGRPTKQKGFYALIQSFERVLQKETNLRLVIIGMFEEDSFKYISMRFPTITSKITFVGFISESELNKWYAVTDIAIVPSLYEQCSYAIIEMMMYGLPIIASDGIGIRDMLCDKKNALIAGIGNPQNNYREFVKNLSDSINTLLEDNELRNRLSKAALETYQKGYHIAHMKNKYTRLITTIYH